ncbi:Translation initiation factor 1A [uncultured archaeon]|nr:Translation initiation factor 1A [uncultured archaeon]
MTPPQNIYEKTHNPHKETQESEEGYYRLPLPNRKKNELFAIADQLLGGSRIHVICEDKKSRMARIPGKMKRKARVRTGDLLIIKPWDIQNEKADIVFRYSRTQAGSLSRRKLLPEEINVF